jgi:hypothetical protein
VNLQATPAVIVEWYVIITDLVMIDSTEQRTGHHTATSAVLENLPKIGPGGSLVRTGPFVSAYGVRNV